MNIKQNLQAIREEITKAEQLYDREPGSVKLLAVSKTRSVAEIKLAIEGGQYCFGENYVQEAIEKIKVLTDFNLEWHFIGPIQANKTKLIAENFSWVHSVDRMKIAERLNDQGENLNVCLQVNISEEATKSGINIDEVLFFANALSKLPNLNFRGLMAIPEPTYDFNQQCKNFHKLREIFDRLNGQGYNLDTLSMGMTDDFVAAIAEGATIIRIGTAIFGPRL
jgi:pyridoxal phosphate enzyme (YggS family)